MPATQRVFISDIHLGAGLDTDWFKKDKHEENLSGFLTGVAENAGRIKDLVLMGDTFDTWVCPHGIKPPSIGDILAHNTAVINKLKDCVGALTNVFYVNGNHDMHVTQEDLNGITKNGKTIRRISEYNAGRLYAEHGSRFAMFNAPDKLHDPLDGYPLGYYISRITASSGVDPYSSGSLGGYVDDLLEAAFTTQKIAESVIEALMELTGMEPTDEFVMPGGRRPISIQDVQSRYAGLFDRWAEKFGYWYAIHAIRGEMGSLGWFADRLCKWRDFKVVVLGHTHKSCVDKDLFLTWELWAYANAGCWCTDQPTYVLVDKKAKRLTASLYKYEAGQFAATQSRLFRKAFA